MVDWIVTPGGLTGVNFGLLHDEQNWPFSYPAISLQPTLADGFGHTLVTQYGLTMAMEYQDGGVGGSQMVAFPYLSGAAQVRMQVSGFMYGPLNAGLVVLASASALTPGAGGQAYALCFDSINFQFRVRLLQLTDGLTFSPGGAMATTASVLHETVTNVWTAGGPSVLLTLYWAVDTPRLRGVRLKGYYDDIALPEIVYTGAAAYLPTSVFGVGLYLFGSTNQSAVYFRDFVATPLTLT